MSLPNYNVYDDLNKIKDYYFKVNNNTSIMENQKNIWYFLSREFNEKTFICEFNEKTFICLALYITFIYNLYIIYDIWGFW